MTAVRQRMWNVTRTIDSAPKLQSLPPTKKIQSERGYGAPLTDEIEICSGALPSRTLPFST